MIDSILLDEVVCLIPPVFPPAVPLDIQRAIEAEYISSELNIEDLCRYVKSTLVLAISDRHTRLLMAAVAKARPLLSDFEVEDLIMDML